MLPAAFPRSVPSSHPHGRWRRAALAGRCGEGVWHGVVSSVAAIVAWLSAERFGMPESFWSAITAITVVQTQINAIRATARDQFLGAAIGGGIAALVAFGLGTHLWSYVLAVVVAITVCWTLNLATAAKLAGVTATIVLLVPLKASLSEIVLTRLGEVAWGVLVAVVFVKLTDVVRRRFARGGRPAVPAA